MLNHRRVAVALLTFSSLAFFAPAINAQGNFGIPPGGSPNYPPQQMPRGYGQSVNNGPQNGELGGDIDQDVRNRYLEEQKKRESTGALNPVMSDIYARSSPEMRARLIQMYQQQHAPPLAPGHEPKTPEEMFKAAVFIEKERQVSQYPHAIELFQKAADADYGPAMCLLADRYEFGVQGVLHADENKGFYWWNKAAAKGERLALFAMGQYYLNGDHVPKNEAKAFQYFMESAQKGFNSAKLVVGEAYVCGEGVSENRTEGLKWLNEANNGGSPEAGGWLFILRLKNCPSHFANRQAFLNYGYKADATWKANLAAGGNATNAMIKAGRTPAGSSEHQQSVNQWLNNSATERTTRHQLDTQY